MKIDKLKIKNFRNISKIEIEPTGGLNIFTGANGQGKTNLLEAIFVLATGSSFRRGYDINLTQYKTEGYALGARHSLDGRDICTELLYSVNFDKRYLINKKRSRHNHKDRIRVVIFTPDDLLLIKGSPSKRRAFLDFALKQISNEYLYDFDNYISVLNKRNNYLKKNQTEGSAFKIINEVFVEKAVRVIVQRLHFVGVMEEICQPIYNLINQSRGEMKLKYALSFEIESDKINMDVLQAALRQQMEALQGEERKRRKTLVGPHLDDINIYKDGRAAKIYASQGQQRNMVICLKITELFAFHKVKGFYPMLLLDDVLSELDDDKKKVLIKFLQTADFQTFLTAVNLEGIEHNGTAQYQLEEGRVERKE